MLTNTRPDPVVDPVVDPASDTGADPEARPGADPRTKPRPHALKRYEPFIAAAILMLVIFFGMLFMPRIMLAISGAGPFVATGVAVAFMLILFVALWLRSLQQRRNAARD
ncbi:hypothetical protein SAMN05216548_11714 [Faunimonas pinastri]|uniref:Uncharacterized protein n=1 Tax=Faunimonas pinastri TaxID=1855383 RepID=A0A1H9NT18_9HYPH|nr:hypothetical protein [Faunimonas pinastri]SER38473.1 hypothetical protein SAMN05216548_11714 [Faunimonas pinastri]